MRDMNLNDRALATKEFPAGSHPSERIRRIQKRYQHGDAYISVERARYFTEAWRKTEKDDVPLAVRIALAMRNVYENMTIYIDPDDRIAGTWTEFFLGIPIDIERGVFNRVLEAELKRSSMVRFRARSFFKAMWYLVRRRVLLEFLRNVRSARKAGTSHLSLEVCTMPERRVNPFKIKEEDRRVLLEELLPYWKGKTVVDHLEKRLAQSGLFSREMHEFATAITGNTSRQVLMLTPCATISTYQGHVVLDYRRVLERGITGIRKDVQRAISAENDARSERYQFLKALDIALEGVSIFANRIAEALENAAAEEGETDYGITLKKMARTCGKVPLMPAETFTEAVQSIWTVKTAVEIAHPVNLHCFGRLDQDLYPYYERDIRAGRIDPPGAREILEELLLKIMSQNIRPESNILANFYHRFLGSSPVTLGGLTPEGRDATNPLTYLFIDAAQRSKAITNVSVRIHPESPDELFMAVANAMQDGTSSYSLFNDSVMINSMLRRGFELSDARDYAIMGCVEATSPGKTGSMSANALLLSRLLDMTLRNGDCRLIAGTIRGEGLPTSRTGGFKSFEELLNALFEQARFAIKRIVDGSNLRDAVYAEFAPAPLISAFIEGCLESGLDVTKGGAKYDLSGISMINSIANLTDSLYVIKKLVFEEKLCTLDELIRAIDSNFAERPDILKAIKKLEGKWGNGNSETDELASAVMKELFAETYRYRNYKGGPFVVYVISMTTHTIDGRLSIATPDGRLMGKPFAASCNPANVERQGVTAVLRSVACLPFEDVMGCAVNVRFHPSAIGKGSEAKSKWASLIRTYFQIGGAQIQPTVASTEILRDAQRNPQDYPDLIVKVGGYSTYFADLGREIQDEIIARTEHH